MKLSRTTRLQLARLGDVYLSHFLIYNRRSDSVLDERILMGLSKIKHDAFTKKTMLARIRWFNRQNFQAQFEQYRMTIINECNKQLEAEITRE